MDPGETCDDGNTEDADACPSTCRIDTCTAGTRTFDTSVTYVSPARVTIAGLVAFVDYPESQVTKPRFEAAAGTQSNTRDLEYGFRYTGLKLTGLPETLTRATFTLCDRAPTPAASSFTCKVLDASDDRGNVYDPSKLTCAVVVR